MILKKDKPNMELFSDDNLQQIIDNGGMIVTPEMCQEEIVKRNNKKYNPFKPYENKIFIQKLNDEYGIRIYMMKTSPYDSKYHGLNIEKLEFCHMKEDDNNVDCNLRIWTSFCEERDLDYYFHGFNETDIETWNHYKNIYENLMALIKDKIKF
jgi:hypothetical protein